jgi:DNA polymerase
MAGSRIGSHSTEIIVCLGATAAQAVIGKTHRLLEERGNFFPHAIAKSVMATVHPSSILRAIDSGRRRQAYRSFVDDLKGVRRELSRTQIGRTKSHAADR